MTDVDVIVVGGGLAGLVAARAVSLEGVAVRVLEARPRVGGRVYSRDTDGHRIELGAHFVATGQSRLAALCEDIGVELSPNPEGQHVFELAGRLVRRPQLSWPLSPPARAELTLLERRIRREAERVAIDGPPVDDLSSLRVLSRGLRTRGARALFELGVRLAFGVEPEEVARSAGVQVLASSGGLLPRISGDRGAFSLRVEGGSQRLCERLALRLGDAVSVSTPVVAVEHHLDGVEVHTAEGRSHTARCAIVAVPPNLVGRIDFVPSLPGPRLEALQRLPMGAIGTFAAVYETPWWRQAGLSGLAFSDSGFLQLMFDGLPEGDEGVLVGLVAGARARAFFELAAEDRQRHALQEFSKFLGARAFDAVGFLDRDWRADPWSRGGPSVAVPVGLHSLVAPVLGEEGDQLLWAASELSREWTGTLEGAVASGESAALAALRRVRPDLS